jgi:hypothetical protein
MPDNAFFAIPGAPIALDIKFTTLGLSLQFQGDIVNPLAKVWSIPGSAPRFCITLVEKKANQKKFKS